MIDLMDKLFNSYNYINVPNASGVRSTFYKHKDKEIANYFILNTIDCKSFEKDEEIMIRALEQLEQEYAKGLTSDSIPLKQKILASFNDVKEASQVDKNTSAIYLLLFEDLSNLNSYKNVVYAIEESPNYFKRYVLPYTEPQLKQLQLALGQYSDRGLDDALSQLADNEDEYFKLANSKDLNSTYSLVIRMFSKLPFLKYKFKTELSPEPIEQQAKNNLSEALRRYDMFMEKSSFDENIDEILALESNYTLSDAEQENELQKLLKGAK